MNRRNFIGTLSAAGGILAVSPFTTQSHAIASAYKAGELAADLVVIGGGLGGFAAAMAALRNGQKVILSEETDWIGGQITQQGVPPDEHQWIESHGATQLYRDFRTQVREYYRSYYPLTNTARNKENLNPGDGAVSRLCHEPRVALAVMENMLLPYISNGQLALLLKYKAVGADVVGDRVQDDAPSRRLLGQPPVLPSVVDEERLAVLEDVPDDTVGLGPGRTAVRRRLLERLADPVERRDRTERLLAPVEQVDPTERNAEDLVGGVDGDPCGLRPRPCVHQLLGSLLEPLELPYVLDPLGDVPDHADGPPELPIEGEERDVCLTGDPSALGRDDRQFDGRPIPVRGEQGPDDPLDPRRLVGRDDRRDVRAEEGRLVVADHLDERVVREREPTVRIERVHRVAGRLDDTLVALEFPRSFPSSGDVPSDRDESGRAGRRSVERRGRELVGDPLAVAGADVGLQPAAIGSLSARLRFERLTYQRRVALADSPAVSQADIDAARAELDRAIAQKAIAEEALALAIQGPREEDIAAARARLEALEAESGLAREDLEDTVIAAPADGVILTRIREPGTYLHAGEPVFVQTVIAPVWVRAYVGEDNLGHIHPGKQVRVVTDTRPDQPYTGQVGFIAPTAEFTPKPVQTPEIRTSLVYRFRVVVKNPDRSLRQGMPVTVLVPLGDGAQEDGAEDGAEAGARSAAGQRVAEPGGAERGD